MTMKNSASSLNTYARCPKLWEFTYHDKLEPLDEGGFEAAYGRAYHALQEGASDWEGNFGSKWQRIIAAHYASHQSYYKAHPDWDLKILATEVKFSFEILPGKVVHGIVDGIVEHQGKRYLIEYKTTGQELDKWFEYKQHGIQPGIYLLAAQNAPELQGYNVAGIIFDVTRRCTLKQKRNESDSGYVTRCADWWYENRHTSFERRIIKRDMVYLSDVEYDIISIFEAQEHKLFQKHRDNCHKFRSQCGWYPVCFEGEKKTNTDLYQVRKKR